MSGETSAVVPRAWRTGRGRALALDRVRLIGIVNATPDSFSDGAGFRSVEAMTGRALRLIEEGAVIIDVGGESTRPGGKRVSAAEQIERTLPFIERLRECSDVPISIDTTRAAVARAALDAGAEIVNDVAAGLEDEAMLPLAAERGCGLILMHRRVPPDQDRYSHEHEAEPRYGDLIAEVSAFLMDRCAAAEAAGVARAALVIDPGLGFGKSVRQNFELIARTRAFTSLGYPLLGAVSRKSFIGAATGVAAPRDRILGSAAASVVQYLAGVRLFRVHDVAAHREALAVAARIAAPEQEAAADVAGPAPAGDPVV